jgi:predicted nucleic acid-binding protein
MTALDTDVLTHILYGDAALTARLNAVPIAEQSVPIVVLDEILRGCLAAVRQAEAGKGSLTDAYKRLEQTVRDSRKFELLPFTTPAELLVATWKKQKLRVG